MAAAITSWVLIVHFFGSSAMPSAYRPVGNLSRFVSRLFPPLAESHAWPVAPRRRSRDAGPVVPARGGPPMDAAMQPRLLPTRQRRYSMAALAVLSVLVTQCAPQQCAPAPAGSVAQQVVDLANQQRANAGVAPLRMHLALGSAAQRMSNDMAAHDTLYPAGQSRPHIGSDGSDAGQRIAAAGYAWRAWAENIAAGQPDAVSVVQAWMSSAGHRANMLDPRYTDIGVG